MKDNYYLNLLAKIARAANNSPLRSRHAAAIILRNEVVSIGLNQKKSHPLQREFATTQHNIYLHAEIAAINNATKNRSFLDLSKALLYVVRIRTETEFGYSEPCKGCVKAAMDFGIKKIIYSINGNGEMYNLMYVSRI